MENKSLIYMPHDFVRGLESLEFDKILPEDKKEYINTLRNSCHVINISKCVYAMYFVNTLDNIKKTILTKELSITKNYQTEEYDKIYGIHIGMIGCGILGQQILRCLLYKNNIPPSNLLVSTRRPEQLDEFKKTGIICINDNIKVCQFAEVLLLCIPPSELSLLSLQIKEHLPAECIVYSILAGQTLHKLATMLGTHNIYSLDIYFNENSIVNVNWDHKNRVFEWLNDQEKLKKLLPFKGSDSLVEGSYRLPVIMIFAALNLCFTISSQNPENILKIIQTVIFGELPMDESHRFGIEDIDKKLNQSKNVSMLKLKGNVNNMYIKLEKSYGLQDGFCKVFKQCCYVPVVAEKSEWDDIKKSLNM